MSLITFADVIEALTRVRPERATQVLANAGIDYRQVAPGSLFIPSAEGDVQTEVAEAFKQGAALALIQEQIATPIRVIQIQPGAQVEDLSNDDLPLCLQVENTVAALQQIAKFWRQKQTLRVIAVTGRVGKTSTVDLISNMLGRRFGTLKNTGELPPEVEIPLTVLGASEVQDRLVLEVNLDFPDRQTVLEDIVQAQVAVVTNLSVRDVTLKEPQSDRGDSSGGLVGSLPPDGVAVLNFDDPIVRKLGDLTSGLSFYYGLDPRADLWAEGVEGLGLDGIRFRLHHGPDVFYLRVPMIGRHSVHTALRAAAVGLIEGLTWQEIIGGLRFGTSQLRLVAVRTDNGALILDDTYNASPPSMLAALNLLEEMGGRKIAVLGGLPDLGPYAQQEYEMVGMRAAQVADHLVTIGYPGSLIAAAARVAWLPPDAIQEVDTVEEAIDFLQPFLRHGDVVLVKGPQILQMDRIATALEGCS